MVWSNYFDCDVDLFAMPGTDPVEPDDMLRDPAFRAFLARDAGDRLTDTPHLVAYYRDIEAMIVADGEPPLDLIGASPDADLWTHVRPVTLAVEVRPEDDGHHYIVAECECDWEDEHGLMMVWRDGTTLCKLGSYDGHLTNVDAFADPRLRHVVYAARDPRFRTLATR